MELAFSRHPVCAKGDGSETGTLERNSLWTLDIFGSDRSSCCTFVCLHISCSESLQSEPTTLRLVSGFLWLRWLGSVLRQILRQQPSPRDCECRRGPAAQVQVWRHDQLQGFLCKLCDNWGGGEQGRLRVFWQQTKKLLEHLNYMRLSVKCRGNF